ncbi:MAG: DOMON-like domain-containing protein [Cyanobacteria bacterium J06643_13]
MKPFTLHPFSGDDAPSVSVLGKIERCDNRLQIEYNLKGQELVIVPQAAPPVRQFDLWEHTCCEFFLGILNSSKYWEFNLSPAGHWNVFRFDNYRQNIAEEMAFERLPFKVSKLGEVLQLRLQLDLDKIMTAEQSLNVGITTVIEDRAGKLSYWALSHPGTEPDFHRRDSFAIAL